MSGLNKQMYMFLHSSVCYSQFNTFINSKQKFNDPKLSVVKKQSTPTAVAWVSGLPKGLGETRF